MSKVDKIIIIPARFTAFTDDNCSIIECYIGEGIIETRKFEKEMVGHIENPTYLFIGLMSGPGFTQATFVDAKDFEDLFIDKWGSLVLTAD